MKFFENVISKLHFDGWVANRGKRQGTKREVNSNPGALLVAKEIRVWIISEILCDQDMRNHLALSAFPRFPEPVQSRDETHWHPPEEGGEALDEEEIINQDSATKDDFDIPTASQQREVMKIHRNLGHPSNRDLAKAGPRGGQTHTTTMV